jgi:energy-coupling factor transporter transmembrane protein EcfT
MNPLLKLIYFLTIGTLAFVTNTLTGLVFLLIPLLIAFVFSGVK